MEQTDLMHNGNVITYNHLCNTLAKKRVHLNPMTMKPDTNLDCETFYLGLVKNVIVKKKKKSGLTILN